MPTVKPLKKNPSSGLPRQIQSDADLIAALGIDLEELGTHLLRIIAGEIALIDPTSGTKKLSDLLDAEQENFDPQTSGLISVFTGPAIRELATTIGVSASPGYQFGRSGNLPANTWLNVVGGVPSNRAGITVALQNPVISNVYVASEDIDTYDIEIFEHEGDEINLTSLGSVSISASRGGQFATSFNVTQGRQLATRVVNGSAKNANVGLQLQGSSS